MLPFLFAIALAAPDPCFEHPIRSCLIETIGTSPYLSSFKATDMTIAVRGIEAILDPTREEALKNTLQKRVGELDFAYFNLAKIHLSFGDIKGAQSYQERLPKVQPLHHQAALELAAVASPDTLASIALGIPADFPMRELILQQAVGLLLRTKRVEQARQVARGLPIVQKDAFFGQANRGTALTLVLQDHLTHERYPAARELQAELKGLADVTELMLLRSKAAEEHVTRRIRLAQAEKEPYLCNRSLLKLAKDLIAVGLYSALPMVLEAVLDEEYGSTKQSIIRSHLQRLAVLGRWGELEKAYDGFSKELRGDAVYPLMILALSPTDATQIPPTRVAFARRILGDSSQSSEGYQESLALGLLAFQIKP